MNKYFGVLAVIVLLATAAGVYLLIRPQHINNRQVAAIPASINYQELHLGIDTDDAQRRLLTGVKSLVDDFHVGIQLGHFVISDEDGRSMGACDYYNKVELLFKADGIAVSGERPTMVVEADCLADTITSMRAIWIPYSDLVKEKADDSEFQFQNPQPIKVRLNHMVGTWPSKWILTEVKIYNKQSQKSIRVDAPSVYKILDTPISISWAH